MKKMNTTDRRSDLPEPVVLTADQIKEIAGKTAGALAVVPHPVIVIAGGIPPGPSRT